MQLYCMNSCIQCIHLLYEFINDSNSFICLIPATGGINCSRKRTNLIVVGWRSCGLPCGNPLNVPTPPHLTLSTSHARTSKGSVCGFIPWCLAFAMRLLTCVRLITSCLHVWSLVLAMRSRSGFIPLMRAGSVLVMCSYASADASCLVLLLIIHACVIMSCAHDQICCKMIASGFVTCVLHL